VVQYLFDTLSEEKLQFHQHALMRLNVIYL